MISRPSGRPFVYQSRVHNYATQDCYNKDHRMVGIIMKSYIRALSLTLFFAILSLCFCSCFSKRTSSQSLVAEDSAEADPAQGITISDYDPSSRYYRSNTITIDYGTNGRLTDIFAAGDEICFVIYPTVPDVDCTKLFFTDRIGENLREVSLNCGAFYEITYSEDKLVLVDNKNEVLIADPLTGEILQTYEYHAPAGAYPIPELGVIDGGYLLLFSGVIIRYDMDGNETGRIENRELPAQYCSCAPARTIGGITYAIEDDMPTFRYWKLDFDNSSAEAVCTSVDFGITDGYGFQISGIYDFSSYSTEYAIADPENKRMVKIADRSNMLIKPGSAVDIVWNEPVPIDEDLILVPHVYSDEQAQIVFVYYDPELDLSGREVLTLGGFDIMNDAAVERAVYEFNSGQDEYLVQLTDFSDLYPLQGELPQAEVDRQAQMLRDFNNGNAPDMFYGDEFDYNYWGRAGLVCDISGYIDLDSINITPSIRTLMQNEDGSIYMVFAAYSVVGYFGKSSSWGSRDGYSLTDIPNPTEGQTIEGDIDSASIVYYALEYSIGSGVPDVNTMKDIVNIALERGTDPSAQRTNSSTTEGVANGSFLMHQEFIRGASDYHNLYKAYKEIPCYIGIPSYNGSAHPIEPVGLMAVSSGAGNVQACCEFVSYVLTDETQLSMIGAGFPVNNDILDIYLEGLCDRNTIPEDKAEALNPFMYVRNYNTGNMEALVLDEEEISGIINMIGMVDSVSTMDYGIWNIVYDEIKSYYDQGLPIDNIAEYLNSRLSIYVSEMEI